MEQVGQHPSWLVKMVWCAAEQVQTPHFRHLTPKGYGDVLGSVSTLLGAQVTKSGIRALLHQSLTGWRQKAADQLEKSVCVMVCTGI